MVDDFIIRLILKSENVVDVAYKPPYAIEIIRNELPSFQASILKEKIVEERHVNPLLNLPVSVIVNFPKIGKWTGEAIAQCEAHGKAWGQWGVLLRALGNETPETTVNPEIAFSRRALSQHSRVNSVRFLSDHVLLVEHVNGVTLRVALLYQYDLCGDDVRAARDDLGPFDLLLKTNPNGSILADTKEIAEGLGIKVFGIKDMLGYLARGKF